jgi:hypothetical protein
MERSVSLPTRKDEEPEISKINICQYAALLFTIRAIYLYNAVVIFCSSCGSGKPVEWGNAAVCMSTGQQVQTRLQLLYLQNSSYVHSMSVISVVGQQLQLSRIVLKGAEQELELSSSLGAADRQVLNRSGAEQWLINSSCG